MKRKLLKLWAGVLFSAPAFLNAQIQEYAIEHPEKEADAVQAQISAAAKYKSTASLLWNEDFANGIPASWVNQGFNGNMGASPNALWEYRGPNTIPDITVGSRGAFAAGRPIKSPSAANGFILFDSDFLDNNGLPGNNDGGPAPSPHVGTLTTGDIDLSGHPYVELRMNVYARNFQSEFKVAISGNGGLSFDDTIRFMSSLATNASTPDNTVVTANVSNSAGNKSNVRLKLIYDGRPGNASNSGLYYWCVDDIEIHKLPNHAFKFVDYGSAPARDIVFNNNGGHPRTGHLPMNQMVPISFDANVENFGVLAQTDVKLAVDIYDNASGNLVQTLRSASLPVLNPGDTANYQSLYTPVFNPPATGQYSVVYRMESDSIPVRPGSADGRDTAYTLWITDSVMALDFGVGSNSLGTPQLGDDGSALANLYYLPNPTNPLNGKVEVRDVWIYFSSLTAEGGDIQLEIYDTANFSLQNGFGAPALLSKTVAIDTSMPGRLVAVDIRNNNNPFMLNPGAYYIAVYMFSNNGNNPIRLMNDQSVAQGANSLMYNSGDNRWWTGYTNSRTLASPFIRLGTVMPSIGQAEFVASNFSAYPNPVEDRLNLFSNMGGWHDVQISGVDGKVVLREKRMLKAGEKSEFDTSALKRGIYVLEIRNAQHSHHQNIIIR